jgi:FkbM family methyltransferase
VTRPDRPLPSVVRPLARWFLRAWVYSGLRPGYAYMAVERYGPRSARGPVATRLVDGSQVTCRLDEHIQRHMYFFGAYEPIEAYLFRALLGPGMTVIDLGANVGQYTLLAARAVGATGRVHALEPIPANFDLLAAHVRANGFADRVVLDRSAAWSHPDTLTLYLDRQDAADNKTDYTVGVRDDPADVLRVAAVSVDDYLAAAGETRADLVKLDIEGAELFALRGMAKLLAAHRPVLLLEVNRPNCEAAGYAPEAIADFLRGHGYRFWEIRGSPAECGHRTGFAGIDRGNFICHTADLPPGVTAGWSYRRILRGLVPPRPGVR